MDKWLGFSLVVVGLFIGASIVFGALFYIDHQEQKESAIYFNGTNQGATNVINFIMESQAVPFFLEDGNVSYIKFTQLCEQLEVSG